MKKIAKLTVALLALALPALTASACLVTVRVACPNDSTASGIMVCIYGVDGSVGCKLTDNLGMVEIEVPTINETYTICVDKTTVPDGFTLKGSSCQKLKVVDEAPPVVEFTLGGPACETPPPPGPCWLTGGGTIGKTKGVPDYSFGGVVYPGCSPKAADGGNWNVVNHANGLHFQGKSIIVDSCSGVSTKSPKVNVNIIDFHGTGILSGIGGNPYATIGVTFVGRAIDNLEPGGGNDMLYLSVSDGSSTVLQIGNSAADPATIDTGNLQIHTSSCSN
jgi:hypothetical protein